MSNEEFTIKSKVELFPQKGGWTYIRVPKIFTEMTKGIADRGLVPIIARINQTSWKTSLLPMGDGTHFIALNKKVIKAESIKLGKQTHINFKFNI